MQKNIYILFPPGYGGTYLSWALFKSDLDHAATTVDDPLNKKDNKQFGGSGTAHLHVRKPTHFAIIPLMKWLIYNRPTDKRVYIVDTQDNRREVEPYFTMSNIVDFDPDPVIIDIYAEDEDSVKFAALNVLTKWNFFWKVDYYVEEKFGVDFTNCVNDQNARNTFVEHFEEIIPKHRKIDKKTYLYLRKYWMNWYKVRNEYNPHEVNEEEFIVHSNPILRNWYSLKLKDLYSDQFIPWLENFCNKSQYSNFDIEHVKQYHQTYLDAQPNLQLFEQLDTFRKTRKPTEWLLSHSLTQAYMLMEVKDQLPDNWKELSTVDIFNSIK